MSTAARNLRPSHHTSGSPTSSQLNRPSPDAEFSASSIAFSIARSGVDPNEQPLKSADALADVAVTASTVSDAAPIVSRTPIRRAPRSRHGTRLSAAAQGEAAEGAINDSLATEPAADHLAHPAPLSPETQCRVERLHILGKQRDVLTRHSGYEALHHLAANTPAAMW
jgi:hypothetical protein